MNKDIGTCIIMDSPEIFHTPTLLALICVMSAMAFVVSSYHWLWRAMHVDKHNKNNFAVSVWLGQLFIFVFVMILSICIGAIDFYLTGREYSILGEILILCVAIVISFIISDKNLRVKSMIGHVRNIFIMGVSCLLGWAVAIGLGMSLAKILKIITVINSSDFDVVVVFIIGLLFNVPILLMFNKIVKNPATRPALCGYGFHKFLWPIIFAYMALLTPLMMQDIANSKGWKDIQSPRQIRQI